MTNEHAQEVPFLVGMEREPEAIATAPAYHDVTVTLDSLSKRVWRADGFVAHLLESLSALGARVRALASMPERGPEDFTTNDFERGMRAAARYGGYREAPKPENNLKAVVIGCTCTLLSAFVLGAWKLSNDSAAIRAEFTEWKQATTRWMDQVDRRLDRQENRRP